ncbi:hypothetical protein KUH32_04045 [Thalassococcus sp. CAU 1522]|uniref:Lipoprotein n=1 Tax=Thalassococcus arenae TaxID=2851652 RepID=A0ABS6N4K0_9RHOB|nr:hypothetical protein [Thalassococcus arenae]MBV2358936.1 hypothetical protein [Thalassococcus arenae]
MLLVLTIGVLASCDAAPTQTAVRQSTDTASPASETQGTVSPAKPGIVAVKGLSYRVEASADRTTALVGLPEPRRKFQGRDVEAAAAAATGCAARILPGEWAFLGDLTTFELSNLRPDVRRPFPGWRVSLAC